MRVGLVRGLVLVACVSWLAGCETTGVKMPWANSDPNAPQGANAEATGSINSDTTGSIEQAPLGAPAPTATVITGGTPSSTGMSGEEPKSDLQLGKRYYRENQFGNAEKHFRRAVEQAPKDLEAWIGLAASYDKLKRFDLADRAYAQAIRLGGPTAEILNNQGYSYMLRGDRHRARQILLAAQAKDPQNPYIKNNLDMLDESFAKRKGVN
jgi:tetratricopeptide (TPR) repeat protein